MKQWLIVVAGLISLAGFAQKPRHMSKDYHRQKDLENLFLSPAYKDVKYYCWLPHANEIHGRNDPVEIEHIGDIYAGAKDLTRKRWYEWSYCLNMSDGKRY
jgi:hypothetical protein